MHLPRFATFLLLTSLIASIVPPGYPAYIGAYVTMAASILAIVTFGWSERATFAHPTSVAILIAISLVATTVPFVYRGEQDLLAPVLMLPMLTAIALGLLARPVQWMPSASQFAIICLVAAALAFAGGSYEQTALGIGRAGLGNNPIHFGSLAAMAGGMAMIGVVAGRSPLRLVFLLGPLLGLGAAIVSGSRGPVAGSLVMSSAGIALLTVWLWRDRWFRMAFLAAAGAGIVLAAYLISADNERVIRLAQGSLNIFRFTGSSDDIRAALYASAVQVLNDSPVVGVGFGQIMTTAEAMFPDLIADTGLENLHADWANMAAMSGGLGLAAWLLFSVAPLLLLTDRKARADRPIMLGAVLLVVGQLALGVSNATYGVLPQTLIYAVGLGYLLARTRRIAMGLEQAGET